MRGGSKKAWDGSGGQGDEALGKSRGGFGTKVHVAVNALGQPVELIATPGQASDSKQFPRLLGDRRPEVVIGDAGYDSDANRRAAARAGAAAVIESNPSRSIKPPCDRHEYRERNVVERFWAWAKRCRRVATRYEKKAANFLGFVHLAALTFNLK